MAIKAEASFSLKDDLFNPHSVCELCAGLKRAYKPFQKKRFEQTILQRFPELELKERVHWMVEILGKDFAATLEILKTALPPPLDPTKSDDDFGKYIWIVPAEFVAKHGCTKQHLSISLAFLRDATQRFTAEGAIRPFLKTFPVQTMKFIRARPNRWSNVSGNLAS